MMIGTVTKPQIRQTILSWCVLVSRLLHLGQFFILSILLITMRSFIIIFSTITTIFSISTITTKNKTIITILYQSPYTPFILIIFTACWLIYTCNVLLIYTCVLDIILPGFMLSLILTIRVMSVYSALVVFLA